VGLPSYGSEDPFLTLRKWAKMATEGVAVQDQLVVDSVPGASQARATRSTFIAPILNVYLVSRLIVFGVLLDIYGLHRTIIRLTGIWDGTYYLRIAAHGYPTVVRDHGSTVIAYFPLYPLLVRSTGPLVDNNWVMSGAIVSLVTGAIACLAVGALARDRAGTQTGVRAGWLVALAPGAAFLSPAYAEGLAISLCAMALILIDRRRWLAAGVIGALATATAPLALPIVVAAGWGAWRARERYAWIAPILASSGFISYCLYLWVHVGTPFAWFNAERNGWGHHFDLLAPFQWFTTWSGVTLVETLCVAVALGGLWLMHRARVPGTWWAFTLPFLASVMFDSALWLTPRLLLSAFPLVAGAAIVLTGKRFRMLLASSAMAMVLVLVAYTTFSGFVYRP